MKTITVTVLPNGDVQFLGEDLFDLPLGKVKRRRLSRIVPLSLWKRIAFFALRRVCGEQGRVAAFTRKWNCEWEVRLIGRPGTFRSMDRSACVAWEMEAFNNGID